MFSRWSRQTHFGISPTKTFLLSSAKVQQRNKILVRRLSVNLHENSKSSKRKRSAYIVSAQSLPSIIVNGLLQKLGDLEQVLENYP